MDLYNINTVKINNKATIIIDILILIILSFNFNGADLLMRLLNSFQWYRFF